MSVRMEVVELSVDVIALSDCMWTVKAVELSIMLM